MKVTSAEKVVRVFAEVHTDLGDFQVYEDGDVIYWDPHQSEWRGQRWIESWWDETVVERVREAGMNVLR